MIIFLYVLVILCYNFFMKRYVELLLNWFYENKRDLPWRKATNPYHVWISEVMLQQTRIDKVISYYEKFIEKIPDIKSLSEISDDKLLKLWEGLGYYSRARNLKKAAIKIMNDFHGEFPNNYADILSLPGVGEYTAGAIASVCFQLPEVAIDGNTMRVYCRLCDLDLDISNLQVKKAIANKIRNILPENPGDFNQAIMELGETICLPNGHPKCLECPFCYSCSAHLNQRETLIPRKIISSQKLEEEYTLFLIKYKNKYALHKRKTDLLKNMWEFPNEPGFLTYDEIKEKFKNSTFIKIGITNTHLFSHKKWFMNSYFIEVQDQMNEYVWATIEEIESNYAIPTAFMPFLAYIKTK